jgi:SNF family Na+-dependent transporter
VLSAIQETCEVPAWISGLPDIGSSCSEDVSDKSASVIPVVALMFVVLMVGVWCVIMALPRHLKSGFIHWIRCLRGRNVVLWLLFLVLSVIITLVFFLFTIVLLLLFQPLCVLGLTISIEWMSFMQEYLHERTQPKKSYTLIWIVVASILVDVSMSIAEHYNHYYAMSLNYVDVIASALFSGCHSFIFGKWLENHKMMAQQTQNEMRRIVKLIGSRVEV